MPVVFVSSLPFGGGERLARELAKKLGYGFLSREDVVARANEAGIPVGKLEVAMVKKPAVQERMARLRDRYLALATSVIAERAAQENIVYAGRAGHLLLPGVAHVLRVRVVPEPAQRLDNVMQRLKLPREKAQKFLEEVDEDVRAWVHFVHGVELDDPANYDMVINLEHLSLANAAAALCAIAELPDFKPTPASTRAMADKLLQARARIRLALDERTAESDLTVRAAGEVVTVTYVPRQASAAPSIPEVLKELPGCREIRCTMAATNVLWIQDSFDPASATFRHVNELARRWGAAVELLMYIPQGEGGTIPVSAPAAPKMDASTGGIEEDVSAQVPKEQQALQTAVEAFIKEGRSGGGQAVAGGRERLVAALNPGVQYSLVIVGDLYQGRPAAVRTRLARETLQYLQTRIKAPTISAEELSKRMAMGWKGALEGLGATLGVVLLLSQVFLHQGALRSVLGGAIHQGHRWLSVLVVIVGAPVMAALYGFVAKTLLKLIKFE